MNSHRRLLVLGLTLFFACPVFGQWTQSNWPSGSWATTPSDFAVTGNHFISSGTGWQGVFLSNDSGLTWAPSNSGLASTLIYDLLVNGGTVFAGTDAGLCVSSDMGSTWTLSDSGMTGKKVDAMVMVGTDIFAGTISGGVYHSTDNGLHWMRMTTGLTDTNVYALAVNGNSIFAGTFSAGVFRSDDNGLSWTPVNNGLNHLHIYELITKGSTLFAGTNTGGVYRSLDNGNTWTQANSGQTSLHPYSFAVSGGTIFVGTKDSGVFQSTDNGNNWIAVNEGMTMPVTVYALQPCGEYLLGGIYTKGAWRRPLVNFPLDVPDQPGAELPSQFQLHQNYPNPFNSSTVISYELHAPGLVDITVFDVTGRLVKTLLHDVKAVGKHVLTWDGDLNNQRVATGVYLCKLTMNESASEIKMVLLK